jgi:hypothetical protein
MARTKQTARYSTGGDPALQRRRDLAKLCSTKGRKPEPTKWAQKKIETPRRLLCQLSDYQLMRCLEYGMNSEAGGERDVNYELAKRFKDGGLDGDILDNNIEHWVNHMVKLQGGGKALKQRVRKVIDKLKDKGALDDMVDMLECLSDPYSKLPSWM